MIPMTKGSRIQFFVSQMSTICQSKLRGYISSENDDIFLCFPRGYRKPRECPSFFPVRGRFPRNVRQEHLFLRWHGRIKTKWYSFGRKTKWYSFHRKIGVYSERLMFRSLNNDNKNETLFCFCPSTYTLCRLLADFVYHHSHSLVGILVFVSFLFSKIWE